MPRATCPHCQRPTTSCYCDARVLLANRLNVVIIQHPLEVTHPFNTGRMAQLSLQKSELIVAEQLSAEALTALLAKPSALLYPSLSWLPTAIEIESIEHKQQQSIEQLIVIDANWRKSKKMLHLNPALQKIPRVKLSGDLKSQYQIRKTTIDEGLSTIESISKALQMLEADDSYKTLLKPFKQMIALQQSHRAKKTTH